MTKKTVREIRILVGQCSLCNRKKSKIVCDKTIKAEGLGMFFKNLGRKWLNISKKWLKLYQKILHGPWILQQT